MGAFEQTVQAHVAATECRKVDTPLFQAGKIAFHLPDAYPSATAGGIYPAVVVEQQRGVVQTLIDIHHLLPLTLRRVVGTEDIGFRRTVGGKENVELAVVESDRGGPLTLSVDVTSFEVVGGTVFEFRYHIADDLPVDEVFRVHYGHSRHKVHGGGYHVEIAPDADNVGVGHICKDHRIGESGSGIRIGHNLLTAGATCQK